MLRKLTIADLESKNDELKNDARSLFHFFSPFFVNLTQLFCQFSIVVQESNNVGALLIYDRLNMRFAVHQVLILTSLQHVCILKFSYDTD